ncbi:hypothetical protein KIMH_07340 [Bombiscardovia apis]|uniref:Periplasmic binding protein domain-containing protein n=1 Tax=Bombiscardovia apis TaxID=2932182 RepID=A0ABM8BCI1_9BIFI|nr:hypothetical protein [Bombiscardovia apis]BDR54623.1 hypothetical protein KIMH_07340 [Bombiscardovia apis]
MKLNKWMPARQIAVGVILVVTLALAGCSPAQSSQPTAPSTSPAAPAQVVTGKVAIFTPADGITISQHTPINKWAVFIPELEQALIQQGFTKKNISSTTDKSLDKQSQAVQDYVVSELKPKQTEKGEQPQTPTTLVVAPVAQSQSLTRQYGDYVGHVMQQPQSDSSPSADSSASDSADSKNARNLGEESSDREDSNDQTHSYQRLVSSLQLAKESGMHVVILSNDISDLQPDLFVDMSNAEQIGRMQAQQVVNKLELDKASKANPRYIEVLLPKEHSSDQTQDDNAESIHDDFAQSAFKGIWQVLAPYFLDGRALSPSGLLSSKSGEQDWETLTFAPGNNTSATSDELTRRLRYSKADASENGLPRVDGVIAMNDFIASGVVGALGDMGYTGSSADVNPEISISGIVSSMTGKKDVQRRPVPQPQSNSADSDTTADTEPGAPSAEGKTGANSDNKAQTYTHWPIVTGYGAYTDTLPQIVDGRQWMTGIEDRQGLAHSLALSCQELNAGSSVKAQADVSESELHGRKITTLSKPLIAISASNLKSSLIDTGYVKPADAGL